MAFWSDYSEGGLEPKRKFTFILSIGGEVDNDDETAALDIQEYLIKKVKKPGFEVSVTEHKFLNHTFSYPGKIKWKEVTFSVADVISPNTTNIFLKILQESGYQLPTGPIDSSDGTARTMSKSASVRALGTPRIHQLDHNGDSVETWRLHGCWIKDIEFGELDYDSEDMMALDVTLVYDFADCTFKQEGGVTLPEGNI